MSRLIDADALVEDLKKWKGLNDKTIEAVVETVNNQPTAYDTEAVVKELEEKKYWEYDDEGFSIGMVVSIGDAITIVRKGGAE